MYPYLFSLFETFQGNPSVISDQVIVQVFQYCLPVMNQSLLVQFQIAPRSVPVKCRVKISYYFVVGSYYPFKPAISTYLAYVALHFPDCILVTKFPLLRFKLWNLAI